MKITQRSLLTTIAEEPGWIAATEQLELEVARTPAFVMRLTRALCYPEWVALQVSSFLDLAKTDAWPNVSGLVRGLHQTPPELTESLNIPGDSGRLEIRAGIDGRKLKLLKAETRIDRATPDDSNPVTLRPQGGGSAGADKAHSSCIIRVLYKSVDQLHIAAEWGEVSAQGSIVLDLSAFHRLGVRAEPLI